MATIRTNRPGPLIKVKTSPLVPMKGACWRLLIRNLRPNTPNFGKWVPLSTYGHTVVCRSKLEACECVWLVGARYFARPPEIIKNDDKDEERYLDWLLANHMKIEPYTATGLMEVTFSDFIRGWYPDAADLPGLRNDRNLTPFVENLLRSRWQGS